MYWPPAGFQPFRHRARAFERLATRDSPAQPTIVTNGTGTGKTEAFLYPVLDEFHTYDGAQGTDVVMLLRRLGTTLKVAEPGRPSAALFRSRCRPRGAAPPAPPNYAGPPRPCSAHPSNRIR